MEAAAQLVAPPQRHLLTVKVDNREAELSWLGTWVAYLLVSTIELLIGVANSTFSGVGFNFLNYF